MKGIFVKEGIKLVRYADDFVLLGRQISERVKQKVSYLLDRLGLKLNTDKTKVLNAKAKGGFDFLGFNFRYDKSLYNKSQKYWKVHPSKKSEIKFRKSISDFLTTNLVRPMPVIVKGLNSKIRGHYNYFNIRGVSNIKQRLGRFENYLSYKMYKYSRRKSQRMCERYSHNVYEHLTKHYGLINVLTIA